ncbi:MAG: transporter ATP-binding protein [Pedosphaera sp.]|nr:transporter ATP-binding protein [Pedosphaera sp.]
MSQPVITIENLSKRYTLAHRNPNADGLRHMLQQGAGAPWRTLKKLWSRNGSHAQDSRNAVKPSPASTEEFWALRNVNLEIEQGDVIGVIGRNGAGKSTLLKILSRITEPTSGRVCIDGTVASLLEVGTGFHPELTGRENIFLNGAILGMSLGEIRRKFDEIVAFAEVEKFLDTPVKRYSSGMYVRLAFAVAAHLESQIMLVDEVLAVGDAQFQRKCLGKIQDVASNCGRTVLFVSHNTGVVASLCNKGILLRNGQMAMTGPVREVLQHYTTEASKESLEFETDGTKPAITRIVLNQAKLGEGDLQVEVSFSSPYPLNPPIIGIVVSTMMGVPVFATDPLMHPEDYHAEEMTRGTARVLVPDLKLHPGEYRASVFLAEMGGPLDYRRDVLSFEFVPRRPIPAKCSPIETIGPLIVEAQWELLPARGGKPRLQVL